MIASMIALNVTASALRRNHYSYSSTGYSNHMAEDKVTEIPEFVFDVMKSKYSKQVIKTYKTRKGAENYIKKNNLDTVVKARKVSTKVVHY